MQRTSSCGQLDNLRKITPLATAGVSSGSAFKKTAGELGLALCSEGGLQVAAPSALHALRKQVLPKGMLRLEKLDQIASELQSREKKLGLHQELRQEAALFDWPLVNPPVGAVDRDSIQVLRIPKPLGYAKSVLAGLYEKKYGISIVCEFDGHDAEAVVDALIEKVRNVEGQTIGCVVPARSPGEWGNMSSYRGHVVPLVIQQTEAGFDVVNLDSLADYSPSYEQFLDVFRERMSACGATVLRHGLVKTIRQVDKQSCHTDALQILKDTLCVLKEKSGANCLDMLTGTQQLTIAAGKSVRFSLPSFLQKTSQRGKALLDDNFDAAHTLQPQRAALLLGEKSMTVGQHRYKYTAELGAKKANYFLVVKAYYNGLKVIDHLENNQNSAV